MNARLFSMIRELRRNDCIAWSTPLPEVAEAINRQSDAPAKEPNMSPEDRELRLECLRIATRSADAISLGHASQAIIRNAQDYFDFITGTNPYGRGALADEAKAAIDKLAK